MSATRLAVLQCLFEGRRGVFWDTYGRRFPV